MFHVVFEYQKVLKVSLKSSDILLNSKATRVLAPTIIALFFSQVSSSTQVGHKKLPPLGARPALEL